MALEQCFDLQLILLAIFTISLIVLMEQIAEYIYFKKDSSMKIKMNQVKEKIAGFIFDLIIESGSKSKFFRKYTNHRFRKQYARWEGNAAYRIYKRNNDLEKENSKLYKRISTLNTRLRSIYDKVKVVATEYPKNAPCPHGEKNEYNDCLIRTDSVECWRCPGFVCRIPEKSTIICWNENFEQSEDLEKNEE